MLNIDKIMKKLKLLLVTLTMLLCCVSASAEDFSVDGIYYNIVSSEDLVVEVIFRGDNPNSYSNEYIGNVVIPEKVTYNGKTYSVTSIGYETFYYCTGLTSIIIPNSVTSIHGCAFWGCSSLSSIKIPDGITSIGDLTFEGCCSLPIENNVRYADKWAVGVDDKSLSQYTLRDDTKGLVNTFSGCGNMTSIIFPDCITIIGDGAFYGCTSLTSITIPDGITTIGDGAFSGCNSLTSIAFPNSLTTIGFNAFNCCDSLTSIIIPESVTSIDEFAFFDCSALKSVKVIAETPPVAYDYTFSNYEIELCVPEKSICAYQTTNPWSKFKTFKNLTGDDFEVKVCATPTIAYVNGKISFASETEGVEFVSSITDSDIKNYSTADIELTVTYNISVYATKEGYKNSEVAKATLCWIDVEPKSEGLTDTDIANVKALPVVVQASNGTITVTGANDGTMVEVYGISGTKLGEAMTALNTATIHTNAQTGSVVIVKVGNKSIKIKI